MLRTLYRLAVNGTDRMISFGPNERSVYPLDAQLYYVPDALADELATLNRMINAGSTDHADAVGSLNGYFLDEVLGYPGPTPPQTWPRFQKDSTAPPATTP